MYAYANLRVIRVHEFKIRVFATLRQVLAVTRIALDHHRRRLEDGVRDLRNAELLVVRLLRLTHGQ